MPKYNVTGWRVVSQYAMVEIEATDAEAAKRIALDTDLLSDAGFEDCGDPEEVDEVRVTNAAGEDELHWSSQSDNTDTAKPCGRSCAC